MVCVDVVLAFEPTAKVPPPQAARLMRSGSLVRDSRCHTPLRVSWPGMAFSWLWICLSRGGDQPASVAPETAVHSTPQYDWKAWMARAPSVVTWITASHSAR